MRWRDGKRQVNDTRCGSSRLRAGMGTFIVIDAEAPSAAAAHAGIEAAYAAIEAVETKMHPTRAGSDVAAINAARPDPRCACTRGPGRCSTSASA